MYSLEYGMMVQVLRQLKYSGEFHADISSQSALRGGGQVIVVVRNGSVVSCFILDRNGLKLYENAEAQRLLPRLGILDWKRASTTVTQTTTPVTPPFVPIVKSEPRNSDFISHPQKVPGLQTHSWSTLQRSVYFLADGTRTIEQIASLLSRPVSTIEQIIHDFETSGVVTR